MTTASVTAFLPSSAVVARRRRHPIPPRASRPRHQWAMQTDDSVSTKRLPNTPCFTASILQSPMPRDKRAVYLSSVTQSLSRFLSTANKPSAHPSHPSHPSPESSPTVAQLNLLVPQLDPSLDIYDRRFLLQLVWAVISATVTTHRLRTRLLVQGRRAFGAIPLSVSGLRRHIDADLEASRDQWPTDYIRSADLEQVTQLDDDDQALVVVSPTNAVSIPVIDSVTALVQSARNRPVIIINPRLADVPSHSGVMQVAGRSQRISFLKSIHHVFYLRILYNPGSSYPPRGILFYQWPGPWQVWRAHNVDQDYSLILSSDTRPDSTAITEAFRTDAFERNRKTLKQSNQLSSFDTLLSPQSLLFFITVVAICAALVLRPAFLQSHF